MHAEGQREFGCCRGNSGCGFSSRETPVLYRLQWKKVNYAQLVIIKKKMRQGETLIDGILLSWDFIINFIILIHLNI